jgi:hypothetical protein
LSSLIGEAGRANGLEIAQKGVDALALAPYWFCRFVPPLQPMVKWNLK